MAKAYGTEVVSERHRHRYEVNPRYRARLEEAGLVCSGLSPDGRLVEFIELPGHPFWVGTQAHPEFKSRPDRPHPLFRELVGAALTRAEGRDPRLIDIGDRPLSPAVARDPADPGRPGVPARRRGVVVRGWHHPLAPGRRSSTPTATPFERDVVRHPGAVAVVAVTDDGTVVLVRQYRPALDRWILEIPAGTCDVDGEPAADDRPARAGRGGRVRRRDGWTC